MAVLACAGRGRGTQTALYDGLKTVFEKLEAKFQALTGSSADATRAAFGAVCDNYVEKFFNLDDTVEAIRMKRAQALHSLVKTCKAGGVKLAPTLRKELQEKIGSERSATVQQSLRASLEML